MECLAVFSSEPDMHSLSQVSPLWLSAQSHVQVTALSVPPFIHVRRQSAPRREDIRAQAAT